MGGLPSPGSSPAFAWLWAGDVAAPEGALPLVAPAHPAVASASAVQTVIARRRGKPADRAGAWWQACPVVTAQHGFTSMVLSSSVVRCSGAWAGGQSALSACAGWT